MSRRVSICSAVAVATLLWVGARMQAPTRAQPAAGNPARFEFEVVESFDATYLGDTPGHIGRGGGVTRNPDVALGDPVFHGERKIGTITRIKWIRAADSLEIEFDPEPFVRISVGESAWISLTGPPSKPAR